MFAWGGASFAQSLTRLGLIDEYRLIVYPVLVGTGKRIFNGDTASTLSLTDATTTSTGVAVLTYRYSPEGAEAR